MTLKLARPNWTADRASGPTRSISFVLRTLTAAPVALAVSSTNLATTGVRALSRPPGARRLGDCVGCGNAVTTDDPFLRYRGDYSTPTIVSSSTRRPFTRPEAGARRHRQAREAPARIG